MNEPLSALADPVGKEGRELRGDARTGMCSYFMPRSDGFRIGSEGQHRERDPGFFVRQSTNVPHGKAQFPCANMTFA